MRWRETEKEADTHCCCVHTVGRSWPNKESLLCPWERQDLRVDSNEDLARAARLNVGPKVMPWQQRQPLKEICCVKYSTGAFRADLDLPVITP